MAEKNELKNYFITASMKERKYIQDFINSNKQFELVGFTSPSGRSTFDAYLYSGESKINIALEAKVRNCESTKYNSGIIKVDKYNRLFKKLSEKQHQGKNITVLYTMFFSDGKVAVWNLSQPLNLKYTYKFYGSNNSGYSQTVCNQLFELSYDQATWYTY